MLSPNRRELLLDALRPDPGFSLDQAVGTTFSLDLDALLTAPLAFALFDVDAGSGAADPIALLAAVRSYAKRVALYCDASRICAPPKEQPLFQLLESTIKPVQQPTGAFHPKVWVLRYRSIGGDELRHRALVLSRNLTFDRSWDTILRLDEDLGQGFGENALELATFLRELGARNHSHAVDELLRTLPRVSFAPPPDFDSLKFWPLLATGLDPMRDVDAKSVLVISPFANAGRLAQLAPNAKRRAVVTRPDTLDQLGGNVLEPWHDVYVLHGEAVDLGDETPTGLTGLHAKVHVFDDGRERRIFTGSANATTAALRDNVELVVELKTTDPRTRVDRLLAESDHEVTLRRLLLERRPLNPEPAEKSAEELEAARLELLAKRLAEQSLVARARLDVSGRWLVELELPVAKAGLATTDALKARLVTAGGTWANLRIDGDTARGELAAGAASRVTSLVAIELIGDRSLDVAPERFVLIARLENAPEDREDRLLLDLLPDAERLMRLLFLLLAEGREGMDTAAEVRRILAGEASGGDGGWVPDLPLFENLVRTFAREPERLRTIQGVIDRLTSTPEGRDRLPEGFLALWATFDAALPAEDRR